MTSMHYILRQDPSIWDLFSSAEEYGSVYRDKYDRFPYCLSSNRNILKPVVSEYLHEQGYCPEYPDGQPFAVCLTHDIDGIYTSTPSKAYNSYKSFQRGEIRRSIETAFSMRSRKLPLSNFQKIMALEEYYGAKSSFYFKSLVPGDQDYVYDIRDLQEEIEMIDDAGWEVGLHGGHKAYSDYDQVSIEKARLEKVVGHPVTGYRNHYLRFRVPDTWHHLEKAGFLYDTTFGYADCVGFRNGMCYPFRPYDRAEEKEISLVEIPLTIMDDTLWGYMKLDSGLAWDFVRQLIDTVEQCQGVITILWHNSFMEGETLGVYKRILEYCYGKGAWITTGEEIATAFSDT